MATGSIERRDTRPADRVRAGLGVSLLLLGLSVAPPSVAQITGSDLMELCEDMGSGDPMTSMNVGCRMFITGVACGLSIGKEVGRSICIERDLHQDELVRLVLDHLRAHPEHHPLGAEVAVLRALEAAFPCARDTPLPGTPSV